uniref:Uncharacterized protein n=1 Tax=Manihot esculenta TaxID=3983 RepID=A0A2C9VDX4_MANES
MGLAEFLNLCLLAILNFLPFQLCVCVYICVEREGDFSATSLQCREYC